MIRQVVMEFRCHDSNLIGILHHPGGAPRRAVVIVVGGPQYRVGSHRQFVLLARYLAKRGVATLRIDHRGVGDSDGHTTFECLDDDIRAAIDALIDIVPSVAEIVIWGLCDAASAAMIYAHSDPRVSGLVLLNPWVRSDATLAQSYLKSYYVDQLLSREFWNRLISGKLKIRAAVWSLVSNFHAAMSRDRSIGTAGSSLGSQQLPFQRRMLEGLSQFKGHVLIILSGQDITATEFRTLTASSREWRSLLTRDTVTQEILPAANHTFAKREWRDRVAELTGDWLESW